MRMMRTPGTLLFLSAQEMFAPNNSSIDSSNATTGDVALATMVDMMTAFDPIGFSEIAQQTFDESQSGASAEKIPSNDNLTVKMVPSH